MQTFTNLSQHKCITNTASYRVNLEFEKAHLHIFTVYQHNVSRITHANKLHYSFCICVGTKGHVFDLHLDFDRLLLWDDKLVVLFQSLVKVLKLIVLKQPTYHVWWNVDFFHSWQNFVANSASHAVAGHDDHILLFRTPTFEYLQG